MYVIVKGGSQGPGSWGGTLNLKVCLSSNPLCSLDGNQGKESTSNPVGAGTLHQVQLSLATAPGARVE